MSNEQIVKCTFCHGTGNNPHYSGTCPVCKGRGKNEVVGKYMACSSCHGSGQKGGTTLTCYDCRGLGVVPDTRETFMRAREEIREAQEEMVRERPARNASHSVAGGEELTEKPKNKKHADKIEHFPMISRIHDTVGTRQSRNKLSNVLLKLKRGNEKDNEKKHFCQCCGDGVNESVTVRICLGCFSKVKELRTYKEI